MSEERKPVIGAWIAALLVALPVLYVASFGPACWMTSQMQGWSKLQPHRAMIVYFPLGAVATKRDTVFGRCLGWWMTLGISKGYAAVVPTNAMGTVSVEVDCPP
jgi:hypothetical protein